ncbi:MAG: FMN-binding protein [Ruminococcus sp.]|nr:FMN-binding protein [Ruminococcus sp.]
MKKNVKEIITPIAVLACICLVVTALLAYINLVTSPIITEAEEKAAAEARAEVLSEADSFTLLDVENLPEEVVEVYKADNDAGYVFILTTKGYGGDMKLICGIKSDGTIEKSQTLSHSETSGLGSKTADEPYRSQYVGKTADTINEVDAISGATISSNAYKKAIKGALDAYNIVKEAK